MVLTSLTKYRDLGLLFLRVALGGLFVLLHGWPHMAGGIVKWRELGHAMHYLHINFAFGLWGFMAALSESVGAVFFMAGFLFRPASILLTFTMAVASLMVWKTQGISAASHPLELAIVFLAFIFIGPGKYSADKS